MDDQGRFRDAALAAGFPDDEVDRFLGRLRLSIRLTAGADGVPAGHAGGTPRLPVDEGLPFVFSVDCAAVPRIEGLPAAGSLLFYLDHEKDLLAAAEGDQSYARVVYVPSGVEIDDPESSLRATIVADLADDHQDDEDEDEGDELLALAGEFWPPGGGFPTAYIGGHVDDEVLTSIAEQTLAGREKAGEITVPIAGWYSAVDREKQRLAGEWLTLASFPTDDESYSGSFVIRYDDLAAGRLDKALSVTTFSE